jgi:aminoglycoside phosphotransferase (APT) family kinase protein
VDAVIDALNLRGAGIQLHGKPRGGATGCAYLVGSTRWGNRILKWRRAAGETDFHVVQAALGRMKAIGYPVPQYDVLEDGHGRQASLQELLPGTTPETLTPSIFARIRELNEMQSALGPAQQSGWGTYIADVTLNGGDGWCLHESLERHSGPTRDLWSRASELALTTDLASLQFHDLVHVDFHCGNFHVSDGSVSGVFDWEGLRSGDRYFDLMTLAFYSGTVGWSDRRRNGLLLEVLSDAGDTAGRIYLSLVG